MPVEPIPCADGGGSTPVEVVTCCAPSIASTALCLADGTPVLLVVRSGCVECGEAAPDPEVVGWLTPAGVFTPGAPPADAGACDAGCVDTVCVQRCDDADGDGEADTTYSELWCIRADGTAELVLMYQDDPSTPYAPVAPVECVYGSQDTETVALCDTAPDGTVTPFLRRYLFLNGTGTYEDVELDGQTPHVVAGTVGVCDTADSCAEPTTPAATLGLCLADGTPIAVVVTRDCDGQVTQNGWLNLTTSAWSAGDPPTGTMACGNPRSITTAGTFCDVDPDTGDVLGLVLVEYTYGADGAVTSVRLVDATTGQTYTPQGEVTTCPAGVEQPERDVVQLCDTATDGTMTAFLRDYARDENGQITGHADYTLDGTPYTPAGTVGVCAQPCQDCETLVLCDVDANPPATIAGTAASGTLPNGVGWSVTAPSAFPPSRQGDGAAWWGTALFPNPVVPTTLWTFNQPVNVEFSVVMNWSPGTGAQENQAQLPAGAVPISLPPGYTYDRTTHILRADSTLTGCTVTTPTRAAGARFRATGVTSLQMRYLGTRAVNTECRAFGHWVFGALDVALGGEFLRTVCRDCTGDVSTSTDTLLDGATPYTPVGLVGVCQPDAPQEATRVDVETVLLCVRDVASGDVLDQVIAERVYDDQSGDLTGQRLTDLDGAEYTLPAGAELTKCPSPDRITRQVCVVEAGTSEFLTNAASATSGQDTDWTWSPNVAGPWHPMYRVAPNQVWTAADTAPNPAHWVSPHSNRTVCPAAGETSPPVPGTWFTRASWNLPTDVSPDSIRIAATVLNADNKVVQWRLNDGAWQPVGGGTLAAPAWTFPPTAVPGGRAGQNDIVVQITETQPAVSCPSPNEAGMILHVVATYDHAPQVWTQVIEPGGHTYYLDENGDRQDSIPAGRRLVACGSGGGDAPCCPPEARVDVESDVLCIRTADGEITSQVVVERVYDDQTGDRAEQRLTDPTTGDPVDLPAGAELVLCQEPACPVAFSTECVGVVTRTEASYDNTSLIGGVPGQCGSVQGPGGQFPCQPTSGAFTITSWIVDGEEVLADGGGRVFNGGPCGHGTAAASGMHLNWSQALTNLDPTGATWTVKSEPACAFFVGSTGGTQTVYGAMTVRDAAGQQWILGPAQACEEVQYTKVYTQECDGTVSVSWLDAQGAETSAPVGDLVPCGTGCGAGGGQGLDVETLTLCDTQTDGFAVPFLRHLTYGSAGQVTVVLDTALDGFAPYTPTGTVGRCPAEGRDVEIVPMCVVDNASGGIIQRILAEVVYDSATGERLAVHYVDPLTWGPVAMPGGTHLDLCPEAQPEQECRDTSTLLLCDLPGDGAPAATVTDTSGAPYYPYTTGVATPGAQALWDGGTLPLPDAAGPQPGTGGTVRTAAAVIQAPRPACDAGTARVSVHVDVTQLGPDAGCANTGFLGLYNGTGEANRVALALAPLNTPAGWSGTLSVEADVPAADLAAGNVAVLVAFDAYDDSGTACPPPRHTGWELSEFAATVAYDQAGCTTQFLRNVTVDCETGAVTAVTDTTLDGAPYTVTGEAGQCTPASSGGTVERCGDTEVVQLCDLTYDPQAPIPTPAGDFTLTGNVVAGNGGTTLWFAQANQPATGVAELTVSGLIPATLYEFRFASAWIGAGGSDPVGNAAIYRLDVLDGTTVLATRTRNVSNGSNVFPGGVLTEDMPPLPFIAPATGAVTIRFTDQTTGGPANDRDLFLMPFEVRTAVLTVTRTPFLRRFTFDCDGGLTSTQDLDVDGFTPYVVEGDVGHCTADGAAADAVTPCDVQNVIQACRCDDTDGDGLADTDYVELIGVDCKGVLTPLGTYLPDLSAPYVPVAPVDCDQVDEGAEAAIGVQARRAELAAGETWDAAAWTTLQSVTAIAHGGTGTVTTADGPSTLHTGEAATWSVSRDTDALLTGPLTITADTGTVTLSYTIGVTL
ncbi:hypothetical protein ABZ593_20825 [Streptomyces sp. NPDC012617]|uniref:hypothetical protein n=1 Tax=Streptomyces TaxID=1883 RepID=UPI0033C9A937